MAKQELPQSTEELYAQYSADRMGELDRALVSAIEALGKARNIEKETLYNIMAKKPSFSKKFVIVSAVETEA